LSHGAGPYVVKNVSSLLFKSGTQLSGASVHAYGLLLEMNAKSIGTAETGCETSFQIQLLDLKPEISPTLFAHERV